MNTELIKKEAPFWLLLAAPVVYLLVVRDRLPAEIPSHWNLRGEVDGYSPAWVLPLVHLGIYLLMLVLPKVDPRKKNYDIFSSSYYKIRLGITTFLSLIVVLSIAVGTGTELPVTRLILISVLLLFAFIGNYLGTVRPNWFLGIRTPWTLDNEEVWRKTHLLASRFWFWGGWLGIVLTFLFPIHQLPFLIIGLLLILSLTPIVYSYFLHQQVSKKHE
jgi:uncharacterized membrane protein